MDAFRLLSRSTNLNKRKYDSSTKSIPSAGAPSHPQMLANIVLQHHHDQELKRKRDASDNSEAESSLTIRSDHDERNSRSGGCKETLQLAADTRATLMTQKERARILKLHKLKIQVMNLADFSQNARQDELSQSRKPPSYKAKFTSVYPQTLQSFSDLHAKYRVSKRLQQNVLDQGFSSPTEIQLAVLPLLLQGKDTRLEEAGSIPHSNGVDIFAISPTGSGKTLAFLISILNGILLHRAGSVSAGPQSHVSAVILAPTHELVHQIVNEGRRLARGIGVRIVALQKGMEFHREERGGKNDKDASNSVNPDIIVSTPALLSNIFRESKPISEHLSRVSHLVLDEADVLLDPMFRDDVIGIWQACSSPFLQSSLWSATMASSTETLALEHLRERSQFHQENMSYSRRAIRVIAGLKDSSLPNVNHKLIYTATEQGKLLALRQILHPPSSDISSKSAIRPPFLVFTQTISRAVALYSELLYDIPAEAGGSSRIAVLHADLSLQSRGDTMARFRKGEVWVLITTDILSRGIDFRGINGVVNFDIPSSSAMYVHRAGRTGRAGREGGVCCTLYTKEDIPYIKNVANVIAIAEKVVGKQPNDVNSAVPKWLLDVLPNLTKTTRSELKKRGVAERNEKMSNSSGTRRMRISTKSGYDRRLESRRKSVHGPKITRNRNVRKDAAGDSTGVSRVEGDGEFNGFDD